MSKVSMQVECFCDATSEIIFKKPDYFTPTIHKRTCPDCESEVLYKFKKIKGETKVTIEKAIVKVSDTLRLLQMEKAQEQV